MPKTEQKSNTAQFFVACLLVLLPGNQPCFYFKAIGLMVSLAGRSCFCFKAVSLIVDLIIDDAVLMALEVAVGL